MTKRMLIDSTHAEETRVVVLDGNRLEDYDVETSTKQQLKGNIYLAKVVRVEPSLQAAFVEYGGGRHGFLAFGEIHPDYYQIPVADRQRLVAMQEAEAREEEEAEDRAAAREARGGRQGGRGVTASGTGAADAEPPGADSAGAGTLDMDSIQAAYDTQAVPGEAVTQDAATDDAAYEVEPMPRPSQVAQAAAISQDMLVAPEDAEAEFPASDDGADMAPEQDDLGAFPRSETSQPGVADPLTLETPSGVSMTGDVGEYSASVDHMSSPDGGGGEQDAGAHDTVGLDGAVLDDAGLEPPASHDAAHNGADLDAAVPGASGDDADYAGPDEPPPELAGNADGEYQREQRGTPRFLRNYKIQEVIRRRQILLIQVVKEERGTKGAALTTYISLAGRFSVLMPNSPRGGGISRKITSASDRRRLKEVTSELDLPRGMGLIVRTAGAQRPKPEILRDCEYLLDQWDQIRELTMKSMAPALIYEEASLIKRAIRDVYSRDVDDILVDGEVGWRAARDFMRMLMPTHAKKVQLWKDPQPLFAKAQVEEQLDAMMLPTVQLRSGGYLVINQTEALVAIDVNSGRSTRERGIEETALRTNLEAAEEAARQLRLRDLAGLIVIDFIDMESRRNNAAVEKKLKDALKDDRARIQLGSISHFGLLEMSRQRLRPSLAETSFVTCAHCLGTGTVRSTESAALHVLRAVEEEGGKRRAAEVTVHVAGAIALYILNNKRVRLAEIEARHGMKVSFAADESLLPPEIRIERVRAAALSELPAPVSQLAPPEPFEDPDEEPADAMAMAAATPVEEAEDDEADLPRAGETAEEREQRGKRRRRRRRGGRRDDAAPGADAVAEAPMPLPDAEVPDAEVPHEFDAVLAVGEAAMDAAPDGDAPVDAVPGETAAEAADRAKRRGRRGGRRRRGGSDAVPGEDGAEQTPAATAAAYQPAPYSPPAYSGPTPADPFGGAAAYDIFDAIEQAEQQRALAAFAPQPAAPVQQGPAPAQAALPPATDDAAEGRLAGTPVIDEMVGTEPVIVLPEMVSVEDAASPETPSEPDTAAAELVAPEVLAPSSGAAAQADDTGKPAVTETPASEPAARTSLAAAAHAVGPDAAVPEPAPAIVPILVGAAEPAEKRRGWWRK